MRVYEVTYYTRNCAPLTVRAVGNDPDDAVGKVSGDGVRIVRCVEVQEARR